ncbi:MAG: hypothetical protein JWN15_4294 [Firmicutes bacterium]|nr:hypothetical protein [Bacillota bacterium]
MGKPLDPGPPLTVADEFCACEAPGTAEYIKAVGAAVLISLIGAASWCGVAVAAGHTMAFPSVVIGLATGWSVNAAARLHRTVALGLIAAVATLLAASGGYLLLLRLPAVPQPTAGWPLNVYDFVMAGVAAVLAFWVAGPGAKSRNSL